MWSDPSRLLENLPEHKQPRNEKLHGVLREEVRNVPWQITCIAIDTSPDEDPDQCKPGTIRLEIAIVWQLLAIQPLRLAGPIETDVGYAHGNIVDQTCDTLDDVSKAGD